jgi:DNA repair protein RecN (Recombination protein N)
MVNLSMLREVGEWLVNIHGQHEHQSLLKTEQHLKWLDLYGEEIGPVKRKYRERYEAYISCRKQLDELHDKSMQALQMQDLYRFQIEEIAAAELKIGEDECLNEEKQKLANAEKLFQHASESYDLLYGGNRGLDSLRKALQRVQEISVLDDKTLQPLLQQMQEAYYQLEDSAFQLRDYRDEIEFNPERLEQIERRLDDISQLRRKYGEHIPDILSYLDTITHELQIMENKDELIGQLQQQLAAETKQLIKAASELSAVRQKVAQRLSQEIEEELKDLHMEKTRFQVQLERFSDEARGLEADGGKWKIGREGWDAAEFMISPNPGEPLRSLSKTASGGELSRIMLAMKAIFARVDRIPVLVFDEVDTGVSGRAAQAIAEKLSRLSRSCQVFSITHLPQVACMADAHYLIFKEIEGERTYTRVEPLQTNRRKEELARMLGGVEVTETTLSHAQEMLTMASEKKSRS